MMAEGSNVDVANCAVHYGLVGRTADHHRTFGLLLPHPPPAQSSKQFCKMAKWLMDMKIKCTQVSVIVPFKNIIFTPRAVITQCLQAWTLSDSNPELEIFDILEKMILSEILMMSIIQAEARVWPFGQQCAVCFCCFILLPIFLLLFF